MPLGYLLGFLLLSVAARGHWKIALILPLYFLADATITLLRRLARGERVWQPHRQHFYQRAVQRGLGHAAVVRRVIAVNAILIGCGLGPPLPPWIVGPFVVATGSVALLLAAFSAGALLPEKSVAVIDRIAARLPHPACAGSSAPRPGP